MKKAGFFHSTGSGFSTKIIVLFCCILMVSAGCEFLEKEEIPPDQLPPVPAACSKESNIYANALYGAYEHAEVSQMQIRRVAKEFSKCLQNSGLSEAEARGIVKNQEKTFRDTLEGN